MAEESTVDTPCCAFCGGEMESPPGIGEHHLKCNDCGKWGHVPVVNRA